MLMYRGVSVADLKAMTFFEFEYWVERHNELQKLEAQAQSEAERGRR
jgi:hypothetical protein